MFKFPFFWLSLCLVLINVNLIYAQEEKGYKKTVAQVRVNFNNNQPEKIYALTSAIFRKRMTEEQFTLGMKKFHAKVGDWTSSVFKEQNEKGLDYLSIFENSRQIFSIKLNDQGMIDRLNYSTALVEILDKVGLVSSDNPLKDSLDYLVEHNVRSYIQKGNTCGLVLAVIDKGKVRKYSYGSINKKQKQLPDAENTIFEIGSVTKTFNSLILAQEVVSGRMKLNDPINIYLPDSIPALTFGGKSITLLHLANHTSGFPRLPANIFNARVDPKDPYKHYLTDSLYSFLMNFKLSVTPGASFSYSNYGAGVLSTILERTLDSNFEQLIISRICKPLNMYHTSVQLSSEAEKQFAQGYNEIGEATAPWDLASLKGSGAIRSTLNDMVKYASAQIEIENPLSKAIALSHQPTFVSKDQNIGLGWRITSDKQNKFLHHSGGTGGFRSFIGFDPDRQLAIIILSNAAEDVTVIGETFLK